jgi:5-methylcytosine-specific restriction enzyme B
MPMIEKAKTVYEAAAAFQKRCLEQDGSLLFEGAHVWTKANLKTLKEHFNDEPDRTQRTFIEKFQEQLADVEADVVRLAVDILAVYYLFSDSVTSRKKRQQIELIASWKNIKIDSPIMAAFERGIGRTGQSYNQRKPEELWFIIDFGLAWKELDSDIQGALLKAPEKFQAFMDTVEGADRRQMRHILLHMLFPDQFEPIASGSHKVRIADAFKALVTEPADEEDALLRQIRVELQKHVSTTPFRYYRDPVRMAWNPSDGDDGYTATDALRYKKQVVLYGPPGTGKTHWAKERAARLIRSEALKLCGVKWYFQNEQRLAQLTTERVHRVQLHPGYSYEDFIRGLHVGEGGRTEYRPGYLLELVTRMSSDQSEFRALPHVLILDEINRTDLSRLLGECFSLLEDRDSPIELPGLDKDQKPLQLTLPSNLFVIGTMNLIDQSLEQIDFALRRRFFWVEHGFDRDALVEVCRSRWESVNRKPHTWERVSAAFDILAEAAEALNEAIRSSRHLGKAFEIGHTYFFDAVQFLEHDLQGARKVRKFYMWNSKGPREAVQNLWWLSISPLLREYLRGLEERESQTELEHLESVFFDRKADAA